MAEESDTGQGTGPRWLPVSAAARALGVSERAVRRRMQRGTLETRTERAGNRSRTLVRVEVAHAVQDSVQGGGTGPAPVPVPDLREHVARLEERLAASEAARERAEGEVDDLRRERDRLLAMLDDALAEYRERRRWSGLKTWLRRLWEGGG